MAVEMREEEAVAVFQSITVCLWDCGSVCGCSIRGSGCVSPPRCVCVLNSDQQKCSRLQVGFSTIDLKKLLHADLYGDHSRKTPRLLKHHSLNLELFGGSFYDCNGTLCIMKYCIMTTVIKLYKYRQ